MKIGFICNDIELISKFREIETFSDVKSNLKIDELLDTDIEILVVSDNIINVNEMMAFREKLNIKHIFYMISSENMKSNLSSILRSKKIIMVPPRLTVNNIIEFVCEHTISSFNSKNNVVTFFGVDSKVGTTMVSQSIAERAAEKANAKVCLLFLNGEPGTDFIKDDTNLGIDDIKSKLVNNILSVSEFYDVCIKKDNLYILPGARYFLGVRYYHPKHIEYLLNLISSEFDLIIIDAGSNIDIEWGMTIAALHSTKHRFLITTQQEMAYNKFLRLKNGIFSELHIDEFYLIINQYVNSNDLDNPYKLASLYDIPLAGYLPMLDLSLAWQCEKEKKTLLSFEDKLYTQNIDSILKVLCEQLGLTYNQEKEIKKKTFLSRLIPDFKS